MLSTQVASNNDVRTPIHFADGTIRLCAHKSIVSQRIWVEGVDFLLYVHVLSLNNGAPTGDFSFNTLRTLNILRTLRTLSTLRTLQTLNHSVPHRSPAGIVIPIRIRDHGHIRTDLQPAQNIT
jgi:hypothetical protein